MRSRLMTCLCGLMLLAACAHLSVVHLDRSNGFRDRPKAWPCVTGSSTTTVGWKTTGWSLSFVIGFYSGLCFLLAILVYAQKLVPGRVGTISGLFFGFAFGIAGIGAALMGQLADHYGIEYVYQLCGWLPLMGVITALLPTLHKR